MKQEINQDDSKIGVYRIITPGGRIYIGMTTTSFNERWKGHHKGFKNGKHSTKALVNAYKKYGFDSLKFEIIKSWEKPDDEEILKVLQYEILKEEKVFWIKHKNSGYKMLHCCPSGNGGVLLSDEAKEKLSIFNKNKYKNNPNFILTEIEKDFIKESFCKNITLKEICEKIPKSNTAIKNFINESDLKRPEIDPNAAFKRMLNEYPIIDWHFNEGKSAIEISKIVGCSNSYISSLLRYVMKENPTLDNSKAINLVKENSANALRNTDKKQCSKCKEFFHVTNFKRHEDNCKPKARCQTCGKVLAKQSALNCRKHMKNSRIKS